MENEFIEPNKIQKEWNWWTVAPLSETEEGTEVTVRLKYWLGRYLLFVSFDPKHEEVRDLTKISHLLPDPIYGWVKWKYDTGEVYTHEFDSTEEKALELASNVFRFLSELCKNEKNGENK